MLTPRDLNTEHALHKVPLQMQCRSAVDLKSLQQIIDVAESWDELVKPSPQIGKVPVRGLLQSDFSKIQIPSLVLPP